MTTSPRNRIKELRMVASSELRDHPNNWRRHPNYQRSALRTLLERVGYVNAVIVRETEQGLELIDGHLRADMNRDAEIPALIVDLDDDESVEILATLDPITQMAEPDSDLLNALIEELTTGADQNLLDLLATTQLATTQFHPPVQGTVNTAEPIEDPRAEELRELHSESFGEINLVCPQCGLEFDIPDPRIETDTTDPTEETSE